MAVMIAAIAYFIYSLGSMNPLDGDFSLNFEFVYYVHSADYTKYMDIQQAINLAIFEAFEKEGIEFAYPTQTLFVNKAD